tara:strand:- start:3100 stop:3678 length:579 start_codon:yes stop_codon:yes gene_type:complete
METSQILYKRCNTQEEILGILKLQKKNLFSTITQEQSKADGFLTCTHTMDLLEKWNEITPHIIAIKNKTVLGYLLGMPSEASEDMPILRPMFQMFDEVEYNDKTISSYNYIVVGQVCIAKEYRGKGLLYNLYQLYLKVYKYKFDFAITEIAARNKRSLQAHLNNGFKQIFQYRSSEGEEWCIVILDWNKKIG